MGEPCPLAAKYAAAIVFPFCIVILGVYGINKVCLYFCIPALILMVFGFLFYATIVYPLHHRDYLHKIGYIKCAIKGLWYVSLGNSLYPKIVGFLTLVMCITQLEFLIAIFIFLISVPVSVLILSVIVLICKHIFSL